MSNTDTGAVLVPGPWEHRYVAANGTRLHVAEAGDGPLVLLLHGYPQFWWAWRQQLPALVDAGYRVAALDLRGHGASDKPPHGYDAATLTADVAALVRSLGETRATIVGHGLGGWLAWAMPQLHPEVTSAIGVLAMPHPQLLGASGAMRWRLSRPLWHRPVRHLLRAPARAAGAARVAGPTAMADPALLEATLHEWSAPGSAWPSTEVVARYSQAMSLPFAHRSAAEAHRWLLRARLHPSGRRLLRAVCRPVDVPVLQLHGSADRLIPAAVAARSSALARDYQWHVLPGVGHFVQEEAPAATTERLLPWLARVAERAR